MQTLSRRGFLAIGGTGLAGAAIAGCGTEEEEPSAERDVELLNAALVAEAKLESGFELGARTLRTPGEVVLANRARALAAEHADALRRAVAAQGGEAAHEEESQITDDVLEAAIDPLNDAIAAYREGAALLSTTELRRTAIEFLAANAAELAGLRGLLGEEPVPEAFVTGLDEPPLQSTTDEPAEAESE